MTPHTGFLTLVPEPHSPPSRAAVGNTAPLFFHSQDQYEQILRLGTLIKTEAPHGIAIYYQPDDPYSLADTQALAADFQSTLCYSRRSRDDPAYPIWEGLDRPSPTHRDYDLTHYHFRLDNVDPSQFENRADDSRVAVIIPHQDKYDWKSETSIPFKSREGWIRAFEGQSIFRFSKPDYHLSADYISGFQKIFSGRFSDFESSYSTSEGQWKTPPPGSAVLIDVVNREYKLLG